LIPHSTSAPTMAPTTAHPTTLNSI
jgi:hypothetical protein